MSATNENIHALEELLARSVMSKFATHEHCTIYRNAVKDCIGALRDVPTPESLPGWISVAERLPEAVYAGNRQSENVLVAYLDNGDAPHRQVVACYWHDTLTWEAIADDSMDQTFFEYATVTHWMPLPSSPATHGEGK